MRERHVEHVVEQLNTAQRLPRWSQELFERWPEFRYIAIYGGRGSSKTRTIARYILYRMIMAHWHGGACRVLVARDFHKDLPESAMRALRNAIKEWIPAYAHHFHITNEAITHLPSGGRIMFTGLELNERQFKGWEDINIMWIEEGETLKESTWNVVYPTIMRNEGAQMIVTWNPLDRGETLWQRFVEFPRDGDYVKKVNYSDNPYLSSVALQDIRHAAKYEPYTYRHLYLGEPDDEGESKVLNYSQLVACMHAFEEYGRLYRNPTDVGLDIADGGADLNSLVVRRGPSVVFRDEWRTEKAGYMTPTAERAVQTARKYRAYSLRYDRTGVGSPILGIFRSMDDIKFQIRGVSFGEAPGGADRIYDHRRTNAEAFLRRNAQMGIALRLRANRTMRLVNQDPDVNPEDCLFIWPGLLHVKHFIAECSRPAWRMNTHGRMEIDKRDGNEKSPDSFDALCLAFARDSDRGLRARV